MANTRGNTFSRGNYNYSFRDPLYWRHSIDQYALVDAPAQIDLALQVSGAKKLAVVGHSQVSSVSSQGADLSVRQETQRVCSLSKG